MDVGSFARGKEINGVRREKKVEGNEVYNGASGILRAEERWTMEHYGTSAGQACL